MADEFQTIAYLLGHAPGNLLALLGIAAVFLAFQILGGALTGRDDAYAAVAGWAAFYLTVVLATLLGLADLRVVAIALLAACVAAGWLRRRRLLRALRRARPLLLLALPAAVVAACMPLLHWDSYWHWTLNASFLQRYQQLPSLPLHDLPSFHAAYPAALTITSWLAGLAIGRFREGFGAYANLALVVVAASAMTILLRTAFAESALAPGVRRIGERRTGEWRIGAWSCAALALAIVLPLDPALRVGNFHSSLADPALGVIVLLAMLQWVAWTDGVAPATATRADWRERARPLLVLGLLGVLLSGTKHSGWVLAVVLSGAGVGAAWLRGTNRARAASAAAALTGGALLADLLWRAHLARDLPIEEQFHVRPLAQWRFDLAADLARGALADVGNFPVYYALLAIAVALGARALRRSALCGSRTLAALAALVALAVPLHLASLAAAYLGTGFFVPEIRRAASLQRYSSHVGYAACAIVLAIACTWCVRRWGARLRRRGAVAAVVAYATVYALLTAIPTLRYGAYFLRDFQPRIDAAVRTLDALPAGDSFVVLGFEWSVNFASYASWRPEARERALVFRGRRIAQGPADVAPGLAELRAWQADPVVDHVWLYDAGVLADALGLPRVRSLVWDRASSRWRTLDAAPSDP